MTNNPSSRGPLADHNLSWAYDFYLDQNERIATQALGRDVMLGQYMVGAAFTGPHEFMLIVVYEGERKKKGFNLTQGTT